MVQVLIEMSEAERDELDTLSHAMGKEPTDLIREAIRNLLAMTSQQREQILNRAAGMWKDRDDLPDSRDLRREWDRE